MKMANVLKNNQGFGLMDLMFVAGISTLILAGVFQTINVAFRMQQTSQVKENTSILKVDLASYLDDVTRCSSVLGDTDLKLFDRDELMGHDLASFQDITKAAKINNLPLIDYVVGNVGVNNLRIQLKYNQGDSIYTAHLQVLTYDRNTGKALQTKPTIINMALRVDPSTNKIASCTSNNSNEFRARLGLDVTSKVIAGLETTCPDDYVVTGYKNGSFVCTALAGKGILQENGTPGKGKEEPFTPLASNTNP